MRVLAIGIHPDDVELGCGGTVAVQTAAGHDVVIADLTRGESSSNGTPEARAREAARAAEILGARERVNVGLPDAGVRSEDPEQTRRVVDLIRRVRPRVVLIPYSNDPHPDHYSGGLLVERALYLAAVHGYGAPDSAWKTPIALVYSGRREVRPDVVVDVTAVFETRRAAIDAHATQFGRDATAKPTPLNAPGFQDVVEARCRIVGHLIGVTWGEAFQTARPVPARDLAALFHAEEDV